MPNIINCTTHRLCAGHQPGGCVDFNLLALGALFAAAAAGTVGEVTALPEKMMQRRPKCMYVCRCGVAIADAIKPIEQIHARATRVKPVRRVHTGFGSGQPAATARAFSRFLTSWCYSARNAIWKRTRAFNARMQRAARSVSRKYMRRAGAGTVRSARCLPPENYIYFGARSP